MLRREDDRVILGIDIGSDAIKVVRGMKQDGGIAISDFTQKRFSTEGTPDAVIRNVQEALSSLVDAKKVKKERVHATISGRKLCIRVITLPVMPVHELQQVVKARIHKYVSPEADQTYFRFFVLGETYEKDIKKLEIMFVAMQKSVFDDYLRLFAPLNIQPQLITSACFGGWNLIRYLGLHKSAKSIMLININGQETDLTVYKDNQFIFTRNISIGAKEFIDKAKSGDAFGTQLPPLLKQQADVLCKEIELTSHHHYQITHGLRIDKYILLGEGCGVVGLIDFLKQKIDISVSALEINIAQLQLPIEKSEEFRKNAALYAQSLGALLSEPDDINLIGQVKAGMKKAAMAQQAFISFAKTKIIVIIFIAVALLLYGTFKGTNLYYKHNITLLKKRQGELDTRTVQLMNVKRMIDTFETEKELYYRLIREHPSYLVIIDQICQAIPTRHIVLDELSFNAEQSSDPKNVSAKIKFAIGGRLVGEDTTGLEVTQFVSVLEQSGYFEDVSVGIRGAVPIADEERLPDSDLAGPATRGSVQQKQKETTSFTISGAVRLTR